MDGVAYLAIYFLGSKRVKLRRSTDGDSQFWGISPTHNNNIHSTTNMHHRLDCPAQTNLAFISYHLISSTGVALSMVILKAILLHSKVHSGFMLGNIDREEAVPRITLSFTFFLSY